jgi:CheY-like chemotaxis protein
MSEGTERNILVVDDEPAIRRLLCSAISAQGYSVFEADGGASALQIAADEEPFDLVVSDMTMPGMDGIALAKRLASDGRADTFLFISGYCDHESMERRMNALPSARYLQKPFLIGDFLRVFDELLGGPSSNGSRSASVRDAGNRPPLRRSEDAGAQILRLRRKSERLMAQAACLVAAARRSAGVQASLLDQVRSRVASLRRIERRVSRRTCLPINKLVGTAR